MVSGVCRQCHHPGKPVQAGGEVDRVDPARARQVRQGTPCDGATAAVAAIIWGEDNACSTHANSRPTALVHAVCQALKARTLSVQPLPAGPAGGKDGKGDSGNNDGNAGGGGQELDCALDRDGPSLLPPSSGVTATRLADD